MRCTLGTTVAACVAVLVGLAILPGSPVVNSTPRALAAGTKDKDKAESGDSRLAAIEQQLDSTTISIDFDEVPLRDVLDFLSEAVKLDILPARSAQIELDRTISLRLKHKPVSVRTADQLVLEKLETPTSYTIRDGIIFITEQSLANEMQVYDCRDLLESAAKRAPQPALAGTPPLIRRPGSVSGLGGMSSVDPNVGIETRESTPAESLIRVITTTVDPASWNATGGPGSIEEFNGLLVVKQSQQAHREVRKLLEMLRTTASK